MELQGDVGHVESRFGPFGDSAGVGVRYVHGLRQTYRRLRICFLAHLMELLGDMGLMESHFGLFRDSVNVGAR
jgi:hypothetical protein